MQCEVTFAGTGMGTVTCRALGVHGERERAESGQGVPHCRGQAAAGAGRRLVACYADLSDRLWWGNGDGRLKAPKPELSIQPQGSLAASLAFLLGSLDAGPGGTAAPGALSLAPDFRLTIYPALRLLSSPFFCSSSSGLSGLSHLLHPFPATGSLLPKPQPPT